MPKAKQVVTRAFKRRLIGFSPDEDLAIVEAAGQRGVAPTRFIREAALGRARGAYRTNPLRIKAAQ